MKCAMTRVIFSEWLVGIGRSIRTDLKMNHLAGACNGLSIRNHTNGNVVNNNNALNVAIIGAGASGLCSAKHCLDHGYNVTIYEQSEQIGGIWYYTDETGRDKYGAKIHTAMYTNLRTNLPVKSMEFPGYPYPKDTVTYPTQQVVLDYVHSYADHFGLKKLIKLSCPVIRVLPIENKKWEIIAKNCRMDKFETTNYDVVFVCTGINSKPFIPEVDGVDDFKGTIIHSHDYRRAEAFQNQSVLVIGAGSSGLDATVQLAETAKSVTLSRHKIPDETPEAREHRLSVWPPTVIQKEDVARFTPTGAEFVDGSNQTFDTIIFATGYHYSFPFLSADCGIYCKDNIIEPLYKQIFNVEHPSMVFIGMPVLTASSRSFDLQVRFALKFLTGAKKLPTKSEMMKDIGNRVTKKRPFAFTPDQLQYMRSLAEVAEIEPVPEVLVVIAADSQQYRSVEPYIFREFEYTILDDKNYKKEKV